MQRGALCRSRRELSNEYLLAKIGVDTAENEPLEVWGENSIQYSLHSLVPPMGAGAVLGRAPSLFPALASATLLCKALIAEFDFIKRFTFLLNRPLVLLFLMLSSAYVVLTLFLTVG